MTPARELRVAVNADPLLASAVRGWSRYAVNLLARLPAHGVRPHLLARTPPNPELLARLPAGSFDVTVAPPMRYVRWEQRWLPAACRENGVDALHALHNYGLPLRAAGPQVLTLHDAIDQVYNRPRAAWRARWSATAVRSMLHHWAARRAADQVITESEHAKQDLVGVMKLPAERVTVVYAAADPTLVRPVPDAVHLTLAQYGLTRPFFLYVGGFDRRKNVPFLVRAFAAAAVPGVDLVLAGGGDRAGLEKLATTLSVSDRVRFTGYVPDADLSALYAGAIGFVYPSEYEGFGLQLVEAMALGCPVLAADVTSLPEIVGDGGETFPLGDSTRLSRLLERLAADEEFRRGLAARGQVRTANFSWDRSAAETVAVYRAVLERHQRGRA